MDYCDAVCVFFTLIPLVLLSNDKGQSETDSCTINNKNKGCDDGDISGSLEDLKAQFRELKNSLQAEIDVLKVKIEDDRRITSYGTPGKIYWYFSAIKCLSEFVIWLEN